MATIATCQAPLMQLYLTMYACVTLSQAFILLTSSDTRCAECISTPTAENNAFK